MLKLMSVLQMCNGRHYKQDYKKMNYGPKNLETQSIPIHS